MHFFRILNILIGSVVFVSLSVNASDFFGIPPVNDDPGLPPIDYNHIDRKPLEEKKPKRQNTTKINSKQCLKRFDEKYNGKPGQQNCLIVKKLNRAINAYKSIKPVILNIGSEKSPNDVGLTTLETMIFEIDKNELGTFKYKNNLEYNIDNLDAAEFISLAIKKAINVLLRNKLANINWINFSDMCKEIENQALNCVNNLYNTPGTDDVEELDSETKDEELSMDDNGSTIDEEELLTDNIDPTIDEKELSKNALIHSIMEYSSEASYYTKMWDNDGTTRNFLQFLKLIFDSVH